MQCPKCHKELFIELRACSCGHIFPYRELSLKPNNIDHGKNTILNSSRIKMVKKGWSNYWLPSLVGLALSNGILLLSLKVIGSKVAIVLSIVFGFSVAGLAMGFLVSDIPFIAIISVYFPTMSIYIKTPKSFDKLFAYIIILSIYFTILYGAAHIGAKFKKKSRPDILV